MAIIDSLLEMSRQDTQVLTQNDQQGDDFSKLRDVDFLLIAKDAEKANIVCSFINDNRYGEAKVEEVDGDFRILMTLSMPSTQHLICSVSGLMTCIAHLFKVVYDGWGCVLKKS